MIGTLRLLDRDIAGVRAEERIRLLTLLDLLILQANSTELAMNSEGGARLYLTPNIG